MTTATYFILSHFLVFVGGVFIGIGLKLLGDKIGKWRDDRVARKVNRGLPWH